MITTPLNKKIDKQLPNKALSYSIQFLVDAVILLSLYGIAALCGFNIFN